MRNSIVGDATYNTIGNATYFFCLWLIMVLAVRISGYNVAGNLSLAMTISNVFFVVANYGMRSFQASDIQKQYTNSQYILSRFFTIIISVFLCAFFVWFCDYRKVQYLSIMIFMLYKALEAFSDVLYGVLQRENMLKYSGISLVLKGILSVIIFAISLILTKNIIWALVGIFFASLVVLLFYDIPKVKIAQENSLEFHRQDISKSYQLLKNCFSMFIVSIAPMILQAIPKLTFEKMYTTEELGIYSSVAAPTVVLSTLVSCVLIPFLPLFAMLIQEKQISNLTKLFLKFIGVVSILCGISCVLAHIAGVFLLSF